ncbi:tripartite tricarboxylate transporter substrate binding protein [Lampropedia puyangensis]|uniref:Tripartite tricarboxylate transporter substrate binding protein n=1 Tax=Lampropedia puyangensis TaxID=1330072 RepID=A0A4S8F5S5_9BURK|nr:tripartite tricarboxylate transporter substrate binding protein [Lampropedia puyangensis]THU01504.1 tripartite tricarboxylate transporter substrate binding protein [Lampropedia puyangensis]
MSISHATTNRRHFLQASSLGLAAWAVGTPQFAIAQEGAAAWPQRPVHVLVGFPGGSSPDLTARVLAERLSQTLNNQAFVVDNRAGASGNIAASALARATDNHTISVMINGNLTIAKLLNPKLNFDPLKDFAPIALIGSAPYVLAANAELAQGLSPAEFLAKAQNAGSAWNYGSPGLGTVAHLGMELIKSRAQLQAIHVPYQGNPQAMQALIGGEIQMSLLPLAMALPQQKAGKLALIGITSAKRNTLTGDLKPLQELGMQGLDLEVWNAVAAPANMPQSIQEQLRHAITKVLAEPDTQKKLLDQGWVVAGTSAEALRQRIAADAQALGAIIQEQNIRLDS